MSFIKRLSEEIEKQIAPHIDAAINAQDFASKEYERGWYDALRSVLELRDQILKEGTDEKEEIKEENEENVAYVRRVVPPMPDKPFSKRF